jgi:hypothetical protein
MNVEIGTEAAHFTEKEYINGIFVAVCAVPKSKTVAWYVIFWCKCCFNKSCSMYTPKKRSRGERPGSNYNQPLVISNSDIMMLLLLYNVHTEKRRRGERPGSNYNQPLVIWKSDIMV